MKVKILYVKDNGKPSKERIVLEVLTRTDIGKFMLCDTTYNKDNSVSNLLRHTYWFPDKTVNKGDFVVLYTKDGESGEYKNKAGSVTHYFYWGLEKNIWNKSGDGAVLFEIYDWIAKNVLAD